MLTGGLDAEFGYGTGGVLNVVTGVPAMISSHLIRSDIIRKVSFTGSVPVGRIILDLCAEGIKPASMELGGHSPVLVFANSDVERAAEICARGKFRNNGQVCIAASRFYVQEAAVERFTERFVEVARGLQIGVQALGDLLVAAQDGDGDVVGRHGDRPDKAVFVVMFLGHARQQPPHPDAIGAHDHRLLLPVLVGKGAAQGIGIAST